VLAFDETLSRINFEVSIFDLAASIARATQRLGGSARKRADAGRSRLPARVDRKLRELLSGHERPRIRDVQRELVALCRRLGISSPSRATIYNAIERCPAPRYVAGELPEAVRTVLHNVDRDGEIPGAQVAFAAFNYGDLGVVSWASGMPWLALHHAARMRGWRPRSLGLLRAVMHHRRLS
jgi:hypothetical protein